MPAPPPSRPSGAASPAELQALFRHFQAGRHAEMAAAALALTRRHPDDGQAWKALGVARLVQRQDALAALQRAAALLPADAEVASQLAAVHLAQGRLSEAEAELRRALRLQPGMAGAHNNLADVLARQGRWAEAEASAREALRLQPALAAAQVNLGQALQAQGRVDEALACQQQALALNPRQVEAHRAAGALLRQAGRLDEALAHLRQALALQPGHVPTLEQLARALQSDGRPAEAEPLLRQALQAQPGQAVLHFVLGNVLADLHRPADAAASLRQALALQPGMVQARANLAVALGAAGQAEDALAEWRQVLAQRPDDLVLRGNLGNALLAAGHVDEAVAHLRQALRQAPPLGPHTAGLQANLAHALRSAGQPEAALAALRQALALAPEDLALHSATLFTQQYLAPASPARRRAEAERFGAAAVRRARPFGDWPAAAAAPAGLRVGLLSPDLRQHPVGYFTESVLAALAAGPGLPGGAGRISLHAYASQRQDDALSRRLRAHCQTWAGVAGLDDAALAGRIRDDGIQLLLDLAGHTLGNRLPVLAWRPAPVQASWLGYCASTGLAAVDALLLDPWVAPAGSEAACVEPLLRLPDSFLCFTPPADAPAVGPLPALTGQGLRLGCFQHLAKLNDAVLALWSRLLAALPGSTLVLQSGPLQDAAVAQQLRTRFAAHGIGSERLQLQPAQVRADYLVALGQVDMVLDPFPYPGGTTTLEALWMGVPVLTLAGSTPLSRQGQAILANLGLHDWVARDADDYLARALHHAADLPALQALRLGLRQRLLASPLCDAPRFAGHLAAALHGLWQARRPGSGHQPGQAA